MKYDFDTPVNREGTFSLKWDAAGPDTLPMWVADMDFKTAPAITEALVKRAAHGIFGYTKTPPQYYQAVTDWFLRRHAWAVQPGWILTAPGVVPALCAIIQALSNPGDKIILQTPVYNCFFSSIYDNARRALYNPLVYKNNTYYMDFEDLEQKAAQENVKFLLLCNPHNPAGRVWTKEELVRAGEICLRHGVKIIADEIHGEITSPGHTYIPFASLSPDLARQTITCTSPSKAFNIAGLQAANIIISNETLRQETEQRLKANEIASLGVFGVQAAIAAYTQGEDWLNQLNAYIYQNYLYLTEFFEKNLPFLPVTRLEGSYLVWVNAKALGLTSAQLSNKLRTEGKVFVNPGHLYGPEGNGFLRLNIACPRALLQDGLERFSRVVKNVPLQNA